MVLRSAVFGWVLASSAGFLALSLAAMWTIGLLQMAAIDRAEEAALYAVLDEAEIVFDEDGLDAVLDAIVFDGDAWVWPEDDIWFFLEEEETIAALRDADGLMVAGFAGLFPTYRIRIEALDHGEIDHPVRAAGIDLPDGSQLTVARFLPDRAEAIWSFLMLGTTALVVIVLPLSLVTGFLLSRGVFGRLHSLSQTAGSVAAGQISARAPTTGSGDEFDRLALGVNQMLDRIETLTRNVESVSVGVAHDLKTPLSHIRGRLELIDRDRADPNAVADHVAEAEARLDGLLRVFDAMLRLGEIEAGARRQAFQPVDLSALLNRMAADYAPVLEDADKVFNTAIAPGLTIQGDPALVMQLVANLLDNALDHARDGAHVHLVAHKDADTVTLEIGDDGPGIAPGLRDRVFERFFRADASRGTPGNGLGLALVRAIADLHGAPVALRDDAIGAVFTVRFPATR